VTHLEDLTYGELQQISELEDKQENHFKILSVHYGISSQTTMGYLVDIFRECELIADLKKKIQVDPGLTREYEAEIWRHYHKISLLNDNYYAEKITTDPSVLNATITFQSMEGQKRAIAAYDISWF